MQSSAALRDIFRAAPFSQQANLFEYVIAEIIREFAQPGTAAIDAGAAGGSHTSAMARAVGPSGAVIAFEPNPAVGSYVGALAKSAPWVNWQKLALSDKSRVAEFILNREGGMGSLNERPHLAQVGYDMAATGKITVQVERLDDVPAVKSEQRSITFIKVDVEGEEMAFLDGAKETLTKHKPIIMMELDETLSMKYRRAKLGMGDAPPDWTNEMPKVYDMFREVAGGSEAYDFFGDNLGAHISGETWYVAIVPNSHDQARVQASIRRAAERFWASHRGWRLSDADAINRQNLPSPREAYELYLARVSNMPPEIAREILPL